MCERSAEDMEREIRAALPEGAKLTDFSYYPQCFGNMIVQIHIRGKRHTFVTDRGEISHNTVLVANSEAGDPFPRLLHMIRDL